MSSDSDCLCMNDNKTEYLPVVAKMAAVLVVGSVIRVGDAPITNIGKHHTYMIFL